MALEIERKFLVNGDFRPFISKTINIVQGYLSSNPDRTVRVRTWGEKAFITIKGKSSTYGTSRFEWEKEIEYNDALSLLKLCEPGIIKKFRHIIPLSGNLKFEVDEFLEENKGLIMAEIELPEPGYPFPIPKWIGKEVTNNPRYYNAYLSKHPYMNWKK